MLDTGFLATNSRGYSARVMSAGGPSGAEALAMLTDEDIARALRCSSRTARRRLGAWAALQHDARVPRVEQRRTGRRGRPAYVVDSASFRRWLGVV